jgi:N-acetyl-anhydromuramyl-L-alanine amidase AmpD
VSGPEVVRLQLNLSKFGYRLEATGVYDEDTAVTVSAFQRHFRPNRVDGVADHATCDVLARLLNS